MVLCSLGVVSLTLAETTEAGTFCGKGQATDRLVSLV